MLTSADVCHQLVRFGARRCGSRIIPQYFFILNTFQPAPAAFCMCVLLRNEACNGACLPTWAHDNNGGYMQALFTGRQSSLTSLVCWRLADCHYGRFASFYVSVSVIKSERQALRWSHYGPCLHLPLLIDTSVISPQQEAVHALAIATIQLSQLKKRGPRACVH